MLVANELIVADVERIGMQKVRVWKPTTSVMSSQEGLPKQVTADQWP